MPFVKSTTLCSNPPAAAEPTENCGGTLVSAPQTTSMCGVWTAARASGAPSRVVRKHTTRHRCACRRQFTTLLRGVRPLSRRPRLAVKPLRERFSHKRFIKTVTCSPLTHFSSGQYELAILIHGVNGDCHGLKLPPGIEVGKRDEPSTRQPGNSDFSVRGSFGHRGAEFISSTAPLAPRPPESSSEPCSRPDEHSRRWGTEEL